MPVLYPFQSPKQHQWWLKGLKAWWFAIGLVLGLIVGGMWGMHEQAYDSKFTIRQLREEKKTMAEEMGKLMGRLPPQARPTIPAKK